jgi:hypothetical protein
MSSEDVTEQTVVTNKAPPKAKKGYLIKSVGRQEIFPASPWSFPTDEFGITRLSQRDRSDGLYYSN